jgi:hypothetical protein
MGFTNETPNAHLPQWVDADKPSWLGDLNTAMGRIDAALGDQLGEINLQQTQINALAARVTALEAQVNTAVTGILARLHALDGH